MDVLAAWPSACIVVAVLLNAFAAGVVPETTTDRRYLAAIESAALALLVAGGVGCALLFGSRLGLVL